jgi:hypothetical protein
MSVDSAQPEVIELAILGTVCAIGLNSNTTSGGRAHTNRLHRSRSLQSMNILLA